MGYPISQNSSGQLIAEVSDKGARYSKNTNDRGYRSRDKLNPHVDTSDMTVLLCLQVAASGGVSSLSSSAKIYNEIVSTHSELLDIYKSERESKFLQTDKSRLGFKIKLKSNQ